MKQDINRTVLQTRRGFTLLIKGMSACHNNTP